MSPLPDGKRNRPGGRSQAAPDGFTSSIDDEADFDLTTCTPGELLVWLSGYRSGLWQGTAAEIARREAEDRAVYALAVRTVRTMAEIPTHDELERRRRDYRRSDR